VKVGDIDKSVFLEPDNSNDLHIKVVDNFLSQEDFDTLFKNITDIDFPWYFRKEKVSSAAPMGIWEEHRDKVNFYNWQLMHLFWGSKRSRSFQENSEAYVMAPFQSYYLYAIHPLLNNIDTPALLKARATFNPATSENVILGGYHTDLGSEPYSITTSIFYINTNNGYTSFLDGYRVKNVANRLLSFPVHLKHSAVSCTDERMRMQINLNYKTPSPERDKI